MKQVLFCGCSYVAGVGFPLHHKDPNLWVNKLWHSGVFGESCEITNFSKGGHSNQNIFMDSTWQLVHKHYDYALITWTSVPRYEMELGLELYDTTQAFIPGSQIPEHRLNDLVYDAQYLQRINDRFTALAHPHREILDLIFYINTLVKIAQWRGTQIFFINALCPWDNNYFQALQNAMPEFYTPYTKKIINIEKRNDKEIFALYDKIHQQYRDAGGIQESHWLNLYQSLRSLRIDTNDDGLHPGKKSNQCYTDLLITQLQAKL